MPDSLDEKIIASLFGKRESLEAFRGDLAGDFVAQAPHLSPWGQAPITTTGPVTMHHAPAIVTGGTNSVKGRLPN
jgi:hypothetical protein